MPAKGEVSAGLDVKPSSNRCPESFFGWSHGPWPARRLALPSVCSAWFYIVQACSSLLNRGDIASSIVDSRVL